jgi:hypothetical protein
MVFFQLVAQLKSLNNLLILLNDSQYTQANTFLGNASIGGHTRHIIELLKCATDGYHSGKVDYVNRVRNLSLETDRSAAMQELESLQSQIGKKDKALSLAAESEEINSPGFVNTTYFRELVYNTEHTIHHLALIRVGLREMKLDIVGEEFGVAHSTLKYRLSKT